MNKAGSFLGLTMETPLQIILHRRILNKIKKIMDYPDLLQETEDSLLLTSSQLTITGDCFCQQLSAALCL